MQHIENIEELSEEFHLEVFLKEGLPSISIKETFNGLKVTLKGYRQTR